MKSKFPALYRCLGLAGVIAAATFAVIVGSHGGLLWLAAFPAIFVAVYLYFAIP